MTRTFIRSICSLLCVTTLGSAMAADASFFARRDYGLADVALTVGDVNGDKILDVVALGGGDVQVLLGNGNGTFRTGPTSQIGTSGIDFPLVTDVNGDGNADLVFSGQANFGDTYYGVGVCIANGDGSFQPAVFYQTGTDTEVGNVVYGDFNGDGIPDIAVSGESGIWLLTGKGGGLFNPAVLTPMSGAPGGQSVAADFNGDGNLDLAVSTLTGFAIVLGNGNGTFQPPHAYTTTPLAGGWLATADLNLDGHPDIVLGAFTSPNYVPDFVLVYLGNGKGGFSAPLKAEMSPIQQLALADVNGDGIPDLIGSLGYVALGNGTFKKPVSYPLPPPLGVFMVSSVVPADLRNDGLTDLVFRDPDGTVSVLLNRGKGTFEDGEWNAVPGGAGCSAAADYNGDGKPDLAVSTTSGISILLGTGQAAQPFQSGATIPLSDYGCMVAGDLNGDGIPDLLVPSNGTVIAYLGSGDGTFTQKRATAAATGGYLALGDFNHDGKVDFATSGNLLALGNGDGTFQTPVPIEPLLYNSLTNIAAGDLNGDGWTDLVLTQESDSYIYVLLNNQKGGWTETKIDVVDGRALLGPTQVLLTDLSGTGNLDIVTATEFGSAAVYLGNGTGAFTASGVLYPTGAGDSGSVIAISDVNGDGIPDLVVTEASVGTVGIFLGVGNGTFKVPYYVGAGTSPSDILLENLHGQASSCGFPDIVVPDLAGGIMVLLNLTASTCPGL